MSQRWVTTLLWGLNQLGTLESRTAWWHWRFARRASQISQIKSPPHFTYLLTHQPFSSKMTRTSLSNHDPPIYCKQRIHYKFLSFNLRFPVNDFFLCRRKYYEFLAKETKKGCNVAIVWFLSLPLPGCCFTRQNCKNCLRTLFRPVWTLLRVSLLNSSNSKMGRNPDRRLRGY